MADSPWLALRQAQEAVANHRPEEAHRLIVPLVAGGYRKAWRLARAVANEYAARAAKSLDRDDTDAAWQDLLNAEKLETGERAVADVRQTLTRLGLVDTRAALEAGDALGVLASVGRLRERGVRHPDLVRLEANAQDWGLATELADRGEFLRALAELDKLKPKLLCPTAACDRFRAEIKTRHATFRSSVGRLLDAAEAKLWRDALTAAEEVLAVAPEHREAKAIRGTAWLQALPGGNANANGDSWRERENPTATRLDPAGRPAASLTRSYIPHSPSELPTPVPSDTPAAALPKRFLLWVDGVGGYLVCLSNRVTFGQATSDGPVDVPLFADVSRLHAELSRDGEGYVVESGKGVMVNGVGLTRSVLAAGDRVTLGGTCQFLFHRPVSVSLTARLELTSGHRLPVAVDGVLLMANELILGTGPNAHVVLPGLPAPVLIYRSKDGLGVRVPGGPFRIDDRVCNDRAALPMPAVVTTDAFTFAVEAVTGRL